MSIPEATAPIQRQPAAAPPERIRTLHLTNAWHASSGGIATFYKELIRGAERNRREMRLIVPGDADGVEEPNAFVRIYRLQAPRAILNSAYRLVLPHRYLFPNTAIRRILAREQPQLIECCDKYCFPYLAGQIRKGWFSGLAQQPVSVALSCERMDENMVHYLSKSAAGQRFARWYMKWIYFAQFDHHIAISDHTAQELERASHGHLVKRGVWVQPMGVDAEGLSPSLRDEALRGELLRKAGGDSGSVLLFYAGRLVPEKNLPLLASTLQQLIAGGMDARLIVAGDGISRPNLKEHLRQSVAGRFHLMGHVAGRKELGRLLASADIFVHPNPREPFGIAPLEAMASGLPLIAPNQGGVTTYCSQENSWPAEPSPAAFANAVGDIVGHPERRERKVRIALETAKNYSWPAVTDRYFDLYDELYAIAHRLPVRGIAPRFYSTPGNWRGQEVRSANRS